LLDGRQPERRLPDPGLADDGGSRGQLIGRVEETNERVDFLVPPDEAMRADSHDSVLQRFYDSAVAAVTTGAELQPDLDAAVFKVRDRPPSLPLSESHRGCAAVALNGFHARVRRLHADHVEDL